MVKRLLVIIDAQNDFTHPQGNYASRHAGIGQITEAKLKIKHLLESFGKEETVFIQSAYQPNQFAPGLSICIRNTFGHEIDADFEIDNTFIVLAKSEHSCFSSEAFKEFLATSRADTLFICGFLAEYCVKQTAIDALQMGCKVFLVEDCIATGDDVQERKPQAFAELKIKGAVIVDSDNVLRFG